MSVAIRTGPVLVDAPGAAPTAGTSRRGLTRSAGLVLAAAGMFGGPAVAGDFKALLADAGSLVFGEDDPSTSRPPLPQPAPPSPGQTTGDATAGVRAEDAPTVLVAQRPDEAKLPVDRLADTPKIDAADTGRDTDAILERLLPPRSDTAADWYASAECLYEPGEPRALAPCVPPPPCDPSQPPHPYDLVGVHGSPSCGPIYRGPCEPRSARNHHGVFAWYHHLRDRMFDHFYRSK